MGKIVFPSELTLSDSGFLFDHATGLTYTLNPTGHFILRALREGKEEGGIVEAVLEEFEVDRGTAEDDFDDFLRQLKEWGVIER